MASIVTQDGRQQLWLKHPRTGWLKFELNDRDDDTVGFEIWTQDNQVQKLTFPSTEKFIEWCQLMQELGEAKLAEDAKRARVVRMDGSDGAGNK